MVGRQLILVTALLHHFATVAWAVQAGEVTGSVTSNLRGKRHGRSRSSHGLRANVFRAATNGRAGLRAGQVPLYVPKMGLANVTEPTPFPPPPPVLHPWRDHQPLDTAVGNYLISGFMAEPTITPPPTQAAMDLAFACPALLTWPSEISVSAPDICTSMETGNWSALSGGGVQIQWATSCIDTVSPGISTPSANPVTTYTIPSTGDHFGSSQERQNPLGHDYTEIRDCGGAVIYTIEEKIYKQEGKPDEDACEKYKSCDGVLYFQYFMKNTAGKTIAMTPYTTMFQESFTIIDPKGVKIATASRSGWDPDKMRQESECPKKTGQGDAGADAKARVWNLKFEGSPPGDWAVVTNQWPIAAFMTMLSHRQQNQAPDGRMMLSSCQVLKSGGFLFIGFLICCCCVTVPMAVFLLCSGPILRHLGETEKKFFPKRMGKPAMYS